jgi:hypothetical protein
MANDLIKIINAETGEEIEREMTEEEQSERNQQVADYLAEETKKQEAAAKAEADKSAVTTKLVGLGLNADDLKAMGL